MWSQGMNRWTHPSVILVGTDLSDMERLMPFAFEQAGQSGARLILLHVIAGIEGLAADTAGMPFYDPAFALESAARVLGPWCASARSRGITCEALVREGSPWQQIVDAAHQFHADRILLGTRSRTKLSKLLLGSVAEQVLRSVNLPVMTVGPEAHLPVGSNAPDRVVLHPTTLGETSRPSAALACQLAAQASARLVLLNVLPPTRDLHPTALDSACIRQLETLASETAAGTAVRVEARTLHGNPSIEILAQADLLRAELIVMGYGERSGWQNLTRDHTVYKVLAHAHCPVMTLRDAHRSAPEPVAESMALHH